MLGPSPFTILNHVRQSHDFKNHAGRVMPRGSRNTLNNLLSQYASKLIQFYTLTTSNIYKGPLNYMLDVCVHELCVMMYGLL